MLVRSLVRRALSTQTARRAVAGADGRAPSQVTAVLGAQWGDEGKGKLADILAGEYDIVARFNGGANAGHTVVANGKKYAFHLLPCGVAHPHTVNVLGNGVVVHMPQLFKELDALHAGGIGTDGRLLISNRAHVLFDFHQEIDALLEKRRGGKGLGTTRKGIGPAYAAHALRLGVRAGELVNWDSFVASYRASLMQHELMFGFKHDADGELAKLRALHERIVPMLVDSVQYIHAAHAAGKRIILEGANAAMLDAAFGTYPFVTSSTTTAGGVATGLGLAPTKLQCVIGVVKAYTTRVGWGPFPTELTDDLCGGERPRGAPGTEIGAHLQKVGFEVGVTTGRKRRCGWLDVPVLQYANVINGFSSLNITKLDVLDALEHVKIGVAYRLNGKRLAAGAMPSTLAELAAVEVEYETMPGWKADTTACRTWAALPAPAKAYIARIEQLVGVPVSWIGTGPAREAMFLRQ